MKMYLKIGAGLVGALVLVGGLLYTTEAPPDHCAVCGERIPPRHTMLYFVLNGFQHERAFHMACISTAYRDFAETKMRELAKQRANEVDTSGRHPDDPLSQTGPRNIINTVEKEIAAYEAKHPRPVQ